MIEISPTVGNNQEQVDAFDACYKTIQRIMRVLDEKHGFNKQYKLGIAEISKRRVALELRTMQEEVLATISKTIGEEGEPHVAVNQETSGLVSSRPDEVESAMMFPATMNEFATTNAV